MKQHITMEQLVELGSKKVLKLANHDLIETIWEGFHKEEQVEDSINVFKKEGLKHSSLLNTARRCTVATLIGILRKTDVFVMESLNDNWTVTIAVGLKVKKFESEELCDALWEALVFSFFLPTESKDSNLKPPPKPTTSDVRTLPY